jgi:hypothetical protein
MIRGGQLFIGIGCLFVVYIFIEEIKDEVVAQNDLNLTQRENSMS